MQKRMEALQGELAQKTLEISSGGGAVKITVNGQGEFKALALDPEFLKEEAGFVQETLLEAIREAAKKAKEMNEAEMQKVTAGFQMPGLM